jgi:hypothetical protein
MPDISKDDWPFDGEAFYSDKPQPLVPWPDSSKQPWDHHHHQPLPPPPPPPQKGEDTT